MGLARQAGRLLCGARRQQQAARALLLPPVQGLCNKGSSSLFSFLHFLLGEGFLFNPSAPRTKCWSFEGGAARLSFLPGWIPVPMVGTHVEGPSPQPHALLSLGSSSAAAPDPQHHAPDPSLQHPEPSGISKIPVRGDAGPGSPRLLLSPGTNPPSPAPKLLQISRRAVSTTAILPNPFSLGRRLFCSNCQRLREVLGAESILTPSPQRVRGKWSKNQLLKRRDTEAERCGDLQAGGSGLGERREG